MKEIILCILLVPFTIGLECLTIWAGVCPIEHFGLSKLWCILTIPLSFFIVNSLIFIAAMAVGVSDEKIGEAQHKHYLFQD
jgi:hypothetical protein